MVEKKKTTFYLTSELRALMQFLMQREDLPKINFLRRAFRMFIEGSHYIDERVLITKRTDPLYIKRDVCEGLYIDIDQYEALEKIAEEKKCKVAHVIFQALVDYCSILANNSDGIVVCEVNK